MNWHQITILSLSTVFLVGCFGNSDLEIENRELKRQIDTLQSRADFLQGELDRITQTLSKNGELETIGATNQLICGGLAGFLCPDGYVCLDKGSEPDATGVCIATDKVANYRAQQVNNNPSDTPSSDSGDDSNTNTQDQTSNTQNCGVLGEKLNRNPLLGNTSRQCCEGLTEDQVSKSYSICRAGEVNNKQDEEIIPEPESSASETITLAKVGETCGGVEKIQCEENFTCRTENDTPDATGTCVTNKKTCAQAGEIPLTAIGTTCCAGLKVKDGTCVIDNGYRGNENPQPSYNIKGYAYYETKSGGFRIKYPQYWYYGGYGAIENSLWLTGFAPEALNDESTNIIIRAKLMAGTSSSRSGTGWCENTLSTDRYVRVEGPSSLQTNLCKMADSAELTE